MAGHHSNWIKVGSGAGQMVSSKGRVYVSRASLANYGLSKDDLVLLPAEAVLKLARESQQPLGQARSALQPPTPPNPIDMLTPTLREGAEKAAQGKTPGQTANRFRTMLATAGKASASLVAMVSKPGEMVTHGLAESLVQLPAPTRRALIVAAGAAVVAATATGVAPPVAAVAVVAAAGNIVNGKVVGPKSETKG